MNQAHQQPERYCVMQYLCDACGHLEPIWNSRNAVTPFIVGCRVEGCDGHMNHVNWQHDRAAMTLPHFVGRVFVSITHEDAARLAEEKWDRLESTGDWLMPPQPKDETLRAWAEHIYGDGTAPYLVSRAEYLRRQAKGGAA